MISTGSKAIVLVYSLVAVALAEPLSLPWVLLGSLLFGAVGGWTSAMRQKTATKAEAATIMVSMAIFGASVTMVGYWYFENDVRSGYFLIGISGICGLVGTPIFDPLSRMATKVMDAVTESIIGWFNRMFNGGHK